MQISLKKYKKTVSLYGNLILLSSFLLSQLSLAEIFLYQNNYNNSSDIYHNIINIAQADTSDPWYNSSYSYRKEITIDHAKVSNTDQSNFPMLVSLTDISLKTVSNGGKVQNDNGYDIIFTNQAGDTKLDHEIESYDPENGTIVMWVKIPTLSASTDTIIYIYYSNKNITDSQENITGVWDDNFKMVQHMSQDPSGTAPQMIDSTQYNNDGTSGGSMTSDDLIDGQVDSATDFDGGDDYVELPFTRDSLADESAISYWMRANSKSSIKGILQFPDFFNVINISDLSDMGVLWPDDTASGIDINMPLDEWIFINLDITNKKIYINGIDHTTAISLSWVHDWYNPVRIGKNGYDSFDGSIDEVRISNIARSSDWIATEYNNQSSPSTFLSLSSEEDYMDHFNITGSSSQTSGTTQTITIAAINAYGDTNTTYTGDKTITLTGANTIDSNIPTFTDKDDNDISFGSSGTITFTNGIATTTITLYKAETANIHITDGTYESLSNLNITVSPSIINSFETNIPSSITSETPFNISLTAKDTYTNTTTTVSSITSLSVSAGTIDISAIPNTQFTDDGIYTNTITISDISQDQTITLTITNGSITQTQSISVIGVSHASSFIPPSKPNLSNITITTNSNGNIDITNLPSNISHIAISTTPDFKNSSWEPIEDTSTILSNYTDTTIYIKLRTKQGATSDVITYDTNSNTIISDNQYLNLQEGDIVKTSSSFDVYIIKYNNNKQYKRLILSPHVFNSYQHLKWNNIKTISEEQLNQYQTSNLVKVKDDNNIYYLTPNGDEGTKQIVATYDNGILKQTQIPDQVRDRAQDDNTNGDDTIDIDSIYEINEVDRESYILEG